MLKVLKELFSLIVGVIGSMSFTAVKLALKLVRILLILIAIQGLFFVLMSKLLHNGSQLERSFVVIWHIKPLWFVFICIALRYILKEVEKRYLYRAPARKGDSCTVAYSRM